MNDVAADETGRRALRKATLRLIPLLFVLYIVSFLDRVNVGFAALQMNEDLGFSDAVYGLGAGIFFIGYFLFEVPSNLITGSLSANKYPPGPRPVPPGVEPISLSPVRIVQGPPIGVGPLGPEFRVIEDFGTVKLDEDKTLEAGVSFCDGNGGGGGTKILPATGDPLPVTIDIGASLIAGGQLARRIFR